MKRPSKKEIKAALDKIKDVAPDTSGTPKPDHAAKQLEAAKTSKRIRKQGI